MYLEKFQLECIHLPPLNPHPLVSTQRAFACFLSCVSQAYTVVCVCVCVCVGVCVWCACVCVCPIECPVLRMLNQRIRAEAEYCCLKASVIPPFSILILFTYCSFSPSFY